MKLKEIFCKHFYEEHRRETHGGIWRKGEVHGGTEILVAKCFYCGKIIRIKLKNAIQTRT